MFRFYNVIGSYGIKPTNPDGLFYNLIKAIHTGSFTLYGRDYNTPDGTCIRDYVHVMEICNAIKKAIENPSNNIENLGHGVGTSVSEIITLFKAVNNVDFDIVDGPRRKGDIEVSVLDNPSTYLDKAYTISNLLKVDN
jgi:UDP-glucose 4-epimerase